MRGTVAIERADAVTPEYVSALKRMLGDEGAESWLSNMRAMLPAMGGMMRLKLTPEWVCILDFEQRFPSALERAMAKMQLATG